MDSVKHDCSYELILGHFREWDFDEETLYYLGFHARRYSHLLKVLGSCLNKLEQEAGRRSERILDVGPSVLTQYIRDKGIANTIDSLGFEDHRFKCREGDTHIAYDLTNTVDPSSWPQTPPYDIIVMAEVIEHLPISPSHVLAFLASLLKPNGFLIIQTPNACSLPKRLRMLCGQNPYEMIREPQQNPGHFREYTVRELSNLVGANGLLVNSISVTNYFLRETLTSKAFRFLGSFFPASMRDGITMCASKTDANM